MPSIKIKQLREKTYYDSSTFLDKPFELGKYSPPARTYHIINMLGYKLPCFYNIIPGLSHEFRLHGYRIKVIKQILYDLAFQRIKEDIGMIRFLDYQPMEMCLYVVQTNGMSIIHIKKKTKELCLEAVKKSPHAINYISKPTMEMYKEAIKQDYKMLNMVYNPSYALCEFAISVNPNALLSIPVIHIELVKKELQKDGMLLQYVQFLDQELCQIAVIQNRNAIKFVPVGLRTEEICKMAVEYDGLLLRFVPKQTEEICRIAINQNSLAKIYITIDTDYDVLTLEELETIEDKSCQICFEMFKKEEKIKKIYCGHYYHKDCIFPWYKSRVERKLIPHYSCPLRCNNHI